MLVRSSASPASLSEKAVAEANAMVPERSSWSMPSWMTSVYAVNGRNGPPSRPASTALAMLPTPACSDSSVDGRGRKIWIGFRAGGSAVP